MEIINSFLWIFAVKLILLNRLVVAVHGPRHRSREAFSQVTVCQVGDSDDDEIVGGGGDDLL